MKQNKTEKKTNKQADKKTVIPHGATKGIWETPVQFLDAGCVG